MYVHRQSYIFLTLIKSKNKQSTNPGSLRQPSLFPILYSPEEITFNCELFLFWHFIPHLKITFILLLLAFSNFRHYLVMSFHEVEDVVALFTVPPSFKMPSPHCPVLPVVIVLVRLHFYDRG